MAKIIKGRNKGKEFTINQFSNDWFSSQDSSDIYGVMSVQLTPKEVRRVKEAHANGECGFMLAQFNLSNSGLFTRKKH